MKSPQEKKDERERDSIELSRDFKKLVERCVQYKLLGKDEVDLKSDYKLEAKYYLIRNKDNKELAFKAFK